MTTTTTSRTKDVLLSLVFSAQELKLLDRVSKKYMQFGEWIRAAALDRATWAKTRKPDPGARNGPRLLVKHLRVSKNQLRLFKLAAGIHRVKRKGKDVPMDVRQWLRDLALEHAKASTQK